MSAKDLVVKRLQESSWPLAVHELEIPGYNENNLATRCSELAAEGVIKGEVRPGKHYKQWSMIKSVFDSEGQGQLL